MEAKTGAVGEGADGPGVWLGFVFARVEGAEAVSDCPSWKRW
jgi:hypothetical protein